MARYLLKNGALVEQAYLSVNLVIVSYDCSFHPFFIPRGCILLLKFNGFCNFAALCSFASNVQKFYRSSPLLLILGNKTRLQKIFLFGKLCLMAVRVKTQKQMQIMKAFKCKHFIFILKCKSFKRCFLRNMTTLSKFKIGLIGLAEYLFIF